MSYSSEQYLCGSIVNKLKYVNNRHFVKKYNGVHRMYKNTIKITNKLLKDNKIFDVKIYSARTYEENNNEKKENSISESTIDKEAIPCHKLILCRIPYFDNKFKSPTCMRNISKRQSPLPSYDKVHLDLDYDYQTETLVMENLTWG